MRTVPALLFVIFISIAPAMAQAPTGRVTPEYPKAGNGAGAGVAGKDLPDKATPDTSAAPAKSSLPAVKPKSGTGQMNKPNPAQPDAGNDVD